MDKKDIMFFCAILESCERFGFVRTIDSKRPVISVIVSPYYEREMKEVLTLIRETIKFEILEVLDE